MKTRKIQSNKIYNYCRCMQLYKIMKNKVLKKILTLRIYKMDNEFSTVQGLRAS